MILLVGLLSPQIQAGQIGWIKLPLASRDADIYYQPLSIYAKRDRKRRVLTLLNYIDSSGQPASIITRRVFDCLRRTKLDLSHVQYDQHWGDGEVMNTSGEEAHWKAVPPQSNGEALLTVTCSDAPAVSIQLQR